VAGCFREQRERQRRVNHGINDLRLLLLNPELRGERRQMIESELESLRLARAGVHVRGQTGVLARHGVYRRQPVLRR
jgi:hypothetical protein